MNLAVRIEISTLEDGKEKILQQAFEPIPHCTLSSWSLLLILLGALSDAQKQTDEGV